MRVSFAIPAHNEQHHLPGTIEAIHRAARTLGLPYEVVVADDASTDATADVARGKGARVVSITARQIAAARNAAARATTGEVIFFVDADTIVNADAVREALVAMERGAVGGGAMFRFDGVIPLWASATMALLTLFFRLARLCGGAFLFARRSAYEAAGGWDQALFAGEEIAMARALKRQGRFVLVRTKVLTSGRKIRTYSAAEILGMSMALALSPRRSVRDRGRLPLWYGPRREDPAERERGD